MKHEQTIQISREAFDHYNPDVLEYDLILSLVRLMPLEALKQIFTITKHDPREVKQYPSHLAEKIHYLDMTGTVELTASFDDHSELFKHD